MSEATATMTPSTVGGPGSEQPLHAQGNAPVRLPRVTIQFCTQCKWMLRAAYFAQELLSTFGLALGEVVLQPATGGIFTVTIETPAVLSSDRSNSSVAAAPPTLLWDRKTEGGFPETKELKRRVRDIIAPGRDLGHVDRRHGTAAATVSPASTTDGADAAGTRGNSTCNNNIGRAAPECEDCQ